MGDAMSVVPTRARAIKGGLTSVVPRGQGPLMLRVWCHQGEGHQGRCHECGATMARAI